jgi:hypothetical protein
MVSQRGPLAAIGLGATLCEPLMPLGPEEGKVTVAVLPIHPIILNSMDLPPG